MVKTKGALKDKSRHLEIMKVTQFEFKTLKYKLIILVTKNNSLEFQVKKSSNA
jgi:hypothetical protein